MAHQILTNFPSQKISDYKKNEAWAKENIDIAADTALMSQETVRKSYKNKRANYKLRVNEIDYSDVELIIDPHKVGENIFPKTFKHIGIGNSKINLLIGEELAKKDDFKAFIASGDKAGITRKEEELKKLLEIKVNKIIQEGAKSKEELQEDMNRYNDYLKYEYQDLYELSMNKLLKVEYKRNDIKMLFADAFEDGLVAGEEIAFVGMQGGYPTTYKVNPLNFFTLGSGYTNKAEDSDVIVEYDYVPIGKVIDMYHQKLKESDITELSNLSSRGHMHNNLGQPLTQNIPIDAITEPGSLFVASEADIRAFGNTNFDYKGNVRVTKVNWKSFRELLKIKYRDNDGNDRYMYMPATYTPREQEGEEIVKRLWITEWWGGTKIADNFYVDVGPLPVYGRSIFNISSSAPNYVGRYYTHNQNIVHSLMDVIKPLDYTYDIVWWKRDMAVATYHGDILMYNLSLVPAAWDPKEWMKYVTLKRTMALNPANEIMKGPAKGRPAGSVLNQLTGQILPSTGGQEIGMLSNMLMSIEDSISKISGVSPQREAQTSSSETASGVERAIQKSTHITQKLNAVHSSFKKAFLQRLLEVSKYAYKHNPEYLNYAFDDMTSEVIKMSTEFCDSDYDLHLSNSSEDIEIQELLKNHALAAFQNKQAKISDFISIYKSESVGDISKKLDKSFEDIQKSETERFKAIEQEKQKTRQMDHMYNMQKIDQEGLWDLRREKAKAEANNKEELDEDIKLLEIEIKDRAQALKEMQFDEKKRANLAKEDIQRQQIKARNTAKS